MKRKIPIRLIVALALLISVGISVITADIVRNLFLPKDLSALKKLSEIEALIEEDYYFSVDQEDLTEGIVEGYVSGIGDSYAGYYSNEEAVGHTDKIKGDGHGIGVLSVAESTGLFVWRIFKNSPAEIAGIKLNDIITHINGESVVNMGHNTALEKIKNSQEELELTLTRKGEALKLSVTPQDCDVQTVFAFLNEKDNIGRIQITSFNNKTDEQFIAAVETMIKMEVQSIIIDLRHNTGGTVDSAAEILDYLLPEGETVHVRYNDGKVHVRSRSDKSFIDLPFVILTDGQTASSAEILCQGMRDFDRAVIIGNTTYGKSVVQRSYNLSDGSKVKFTVGEFLSAKGESYNGVGIEPDIKIENSEFEDSRYYFMNESRDKVLSAAYEYLIQPS